ncbi:MAG: hypothetical protein U0136_07645 [Bdellovibrionota bacterium]
MVAVLEMDRIRKRRRKKRAGSLSPLASFLARHNLRVFVDHTVDDYKQKKVDDAQKSYQATCKQIARGEWLPARVKWLWARINAIGIVIAVTGLVGLAFGIVAALPLLAFSKDLAGLVIGLPAGLAVTGFLIVASADAIFSPIAGPERSMKNLKRYAALAQASPEIEWKTMPYDDYVRRYPVPREVRKLARQLKTGVPGAQLSVEHTAVVRFPSVDAKMWAYNPDPFLSITYGAESYRVAGWDEALERLPCRQPR